MAKELVDLMIKLGFPTFTVIGYDRGGRVDSGSRPLGRR